jgi:hypothetical protein
LNPFLAYCKVAQLTIITNGHQMVTVFSGDYSFVNVPRVFFVIYYCEG